MKMLMGAVIVLSMAAVTACGKKPEVADEKIMNLLTKKLQKSRNLLTKKLQKSRNLLTKKLQKSRNLPDRVLKEWQISLTGMVHITVKTENISRCMTRMRIICFFLTQRAAMSI